MNLTQTIYGRPMITEKDKTDLINIIKSIDVKKMDVDHPDERIVKWFRFGTYNAFQIVCDIILAMPDNKKKPAKDKVKTT